MQPCHDFGVSSVGDVVVTGAASASPHNPSKGFQIVGNGYTCQLACHFCNGYTCQLACHNMIIFIFILCHIPQNDELTGGTNTNDLTAGCHPGDGFVPSEDLKTNDLNMALPNTSAVHLQRTYEDATLAREASEGGSGRLLSVTNTPTQVTTEHRAKRVKSSKPHHDSDAKDDPDSKDYNAEEHKYKDDYHAYHGDSYGYSYGPEGLCFTCASGWWSPGGFGPCLPCGGSKESALRFFTDLGASHPHQCLCRPGFGGQNCELCPANTFRWVWHVLHLTAAE